ncbi:CHAD domain-containing protein [Arthrobacter sp. NPDC058097]|uniref:CHAD domain-containing protein n=1 Tax=Arthrobacter sp. NPDC058097 TaxID=3346340 RepID=UPI0036DB1DE9
MLKALEKTHHQAGPVESSFLFDQVAALLRYDPSVRSGEQDASAAMSAAAGRVWSVLGDRRVFDRTAVDGLRAELTWLSESLAPLSRCTPVHDPDRSNTRGTALGSAYEAAYDRALAALETDRYFRLVADLQRLCSAPPVTQTRRSHLYGRHLYRG